MYMTIVGKVSLQILHCLPVYSLSEVKQMRVIPCLRFERLENARAFSMRLIPVEGETNQRSDRKGSVMKRAASFVLSVLLISQMVGVATAQDSLKVRMLGEVHHFVQQSHDVAMSGHYAFIASGAASGLRVLDLSDPAAPVEVGCAINTDTCP